MLLITFIAIIILISGCSSKFDKCDLNKDGKVSSVEKQKCEQPTNGGAKGKCSDGICQTLEKQRGTCPKDCEKESITPQLDSNSPFGAHGEDIINELYDIGIKIKRNAGSKGLVWDLIEPNLDGNYKWDSLDNDLEKSESLGIKLMVTIKSSNQKDQANCGCIRERCKYNPCDWNKYELFLKNAIGRYKDKIKYWQVENEIDSGDHYYEGTPEEYAELLRKSYVIIKESCPECSILIAGSNYCSFIGAGEDTSNTDVYPRILNSLKKDLSCSNGCFDIFDVHVGQGCLVNFDLSKIHTKIEDSFRDIKVLLNDYKWSKPIWSSEFGPLNKKVSNKGIENTLIKSFVVGLNAGFEKLFWRTSENPSRIIDDNGKKTNAYHAYKTLINEIEGFNSVSKLAEGQYKFKINEKNMYVLWCDTGSCSLSSEIAGEVKVIDYYGNEESMNVNKIILSESPIFVEIKS